MSDDMIDADNTKALVQAALQSNRNYRTALDTFASQLASELHELDELLVSSSQLHRRGWFCALIQEFRLGRSPLLRGRQRALRKSSSASCPSLVLRGHGRPSHCRIVWMRYAVPYFPAPLLTCQLGIAVLRGRVETRTIY